MATHDNGQVYAWGWNEGGQVGMYGAEYPRPTQIKQLEGQRISVISASLSHSGKINDLLHLYNLISLFSCCY